MNRSSQLTFTRAGAGTAIHLCVAGSPIDDEPFYRFTRLCRYAHGSPGQWDYDDLDVSVVSILLYREPGAPHRNFRVLSAEGDVIVIDDALRRERIAGAGIESPDSIGYGRMTRLRSIGGELFACGEGGQVYRRVAPGSWKPLDPKRLQRPKGADVLLYYDVNGPSENELYVVGKQGTLLAWDGSVFTSLRAVTRQSLIEVFVEDERTIWICGRKGTLLRGNRHDGFRRMHGATTQLFSSLTRFQDRMYLASQASPGGLFSFDGSSFEQVRTGLTPEIRAVHTVGVADGVLWVVGAQDIARFDGSTWERIDHPDNPLIR